MPDLAKDLEKIILKAGIDGALTEEAVNQFHSLVKERDALKTSLAHEEKVRKEEADKAMRYHEQLAAANEMLSNWATREEELKDRESKVTELEIRKECAETRVADHQEMFRIVFRNAIVRKEVMTPLEAGEPNQYNSCPSGGYAQKDTVEEEEQ